MNTNRITRLLATLFTCCTLLTPLHQAQAQDHIYKSPVCRTRGHLTNSLHTFSKKKQGRVAFLGGSITNMKGWRQMVMEHLTKRFPETSFEFINAGIPSIGSVPNAFRLQRDVLEKGPIDLLFVESAVNDGTNEPTYIGPLRGMEGVIRHMRKASPMTDIIMLDFIYEPYIEMLEAGIEPDVILTHERVANHYQVPSIRLDLDIFRRLKLKEFTWKQFGGTHPRKLGHGYYLAAIKKLLAEMWVQTGAKKAHTLPEKMLDPASYAGGRFVDIHDLPKANGWNIVEHWMAPEIAAPQTTTSSNKMDNAGDYVRVRVREGFSEVPMLEVTTPNKVLRFDFEGNAIGIFCVAGPSAGIIKYRIDKGEWRKLDTFTQWSSKLYIPWLYVLADGLDYGTHRMEMCMDKAHHPDSKGTSLQIRQVVVNTEE